MKIDVRKGKFNIPELKCGNQDLGNISSQGFSVEIDETEDEYRINFQVDTSTNLRTRNKEGDVYLDAQKLIECINTFESLMITDEMIIKDLPKILRNAIKKEKLVKYLLSIEVSPNDIRIMPVRMEFGNYLRFVKK